MSYNTSDARITRRWNVEIERLRARAANLARRLPLEDAGAVELFGSCLSLSESLLRELSGLMLTTDALRRQASLLDRWWTEVFDAMPVACVEADEGGGILQANRAAAVLLNISARHLQRRQLRPFVQERERFASFLQELSFEPSVMHEATFTIRPRERAAVAVHATVMRRSPGEQATSLWFLVPAGRVASDTADALVGKSARPARVNGAGESTVVADAAEGL